MAAPDVFIGEAPGRIDFMGGVADYSGSLVLEMPIRATTRVGIRPIREKSLRLASGSYGRSTIDFLPFLNALKEGAAENVFRKLIDSAGLPVWARYPVGCTLIFCLKMRWLPTGGLAFQIRSRVPPSMGVSSSAALEIATLRALAQLARRRLPGRLLAHLGQQAENRMVGAPCGLMDQLTCAFGKPGHLLPILCQPDQLQKPVKIPAGILVVGWPSGVKHAVSSSPYATARAAAFMGRKIIETQFHRRRNHAADIPLNFFHNQAAAILPQTMSGREFLKIWRFVDDPLSKIDADTHYPVQAALRFPVEENARCQQAIALLSRAGGGSGIRSETALREAGNLMLQSHAGYSAMGLGSPETDRMVAALAKAGPVRGIYGARVSGGGSGGTVVVLLAQRALPLLRNLSRNIRFSTAGPLPLIR